MNKFEQLIEYIINDEEVKARELFHDVVVEKSREIYENLMADEAANETAMMGGDSADGDISWPYIEATMPVWKLTGEPQAIGNWNHKSGHAYPPEAMRHMMQWFERYLKG